MKIENYKYVQELMKQYEDAISNEGNYDNAIKAVKSGISSSLFIFQGGVKKIEICGISLTLNEKHLEDICKILEEAKGSESERIKQRILEL